jgi:hypothetical protein
MAEINARVENAKKVITGNVAMLDMLEAEPATELMNWGIELAAQIAQSTEGMDDTAAEQTLEPRMKALRQFMRAAGNWAAGKYDAASRADLSAKLGEQWKTMLKRDAPAGLDALMHLVDDTTKTPLQLILKLKESLSSSK